jgi:hypothetical protein
MINCKKIWKQMFCYLLSFALVMTTEGVARAADSLAVQDLKNFIQDTGWTQSQSLKTFLPKVKKYLHPKIYNRLQAYSDLNPNAQVPKIEIQKINDTGKVKILISLNKKIEIVELDLGKSFSDRETKFAKITGKSFSYDDAFYSEQWQKIKPNSLLTFSEIKTLAKIDPVRAENYLVQYQKMISELEQFYKLNSSQIESQAKIYSPWWMNVAFAQESLNPKPPVKSSAKSTAKPSTKATQTKKGVSSAPIDYSKDGAPCVVAGYLSKVTKGSCGGADPSEFRGECKKNELTCSPFVFGFQQSGQTFCVPQRPAEKVSVTCDQVSNQSYSQRNSTKNCEVKGRNKALCNLLDDVINKCQEKELSVFSPCTPDAYINELQQHIEVAFGQCSPIETGGSSLGFEGFKALRQLDENFRLDYKDVKRTWTGGKTQAKSDIHHQKACSTLINRFMDLEKEAKLAQEVIDTTTSKVTTVTVIDDPHRKIPTVEVPAPPQSAPVVAAFPREEDVMRIPQQNKEEPDRDDNSIWGLLFIAGIGACVFYFCRSKDHDPMPTVGKGTEPVLQRPATNRPRPLPAPSKTTK